MNEKTDTFIELHVPDFQAAIDFYKILGFKVIWVNDDYLVLKRGDSALFFYGGNGIIYEHPYFGQFSKKTKRGYGVEIVLYVENVKQFYKKIKGKVKVVESLKLKPWGEWDFRIEDPFGFYIRIGEPISIIGNKEMISKTPAVVKRKNLRI